MANAPAYRASDGSETDERGTLRLWIAVSSHRPLRFAAGPFGGG